MLHLAEATQQLYSAVTTGAVPLDQAATLLGDRLAQLASSESWQHVRVRLNKHVPPVGADGVGSEAPTYPGVGS